MNPEPSHVWTGFQIADPAVNHDVFLSVLVGIISSLAENAT